MRVREYRCATSSHACERIGRSPALAAPGDQRFDYVHILLDCVPRARHADLVRHHLAHTVRPGTGRHGRAPLPTAWLPAGPPTILGAWS